MLRCCLPLSDHDVFRPFGGLKSLVLLRKIYGSRIHLTALISYFYGALPREVFEFQRFLQIRSVFAHHVDPVVSSGTMSVEADSGSRFGVLLGHT